MRHAKDVNQLKIMEYLRNELGAKIPISLKSLTQTDNFCDLAIGFRGFNYLWEIKTEKGIVTKEQRILHKNWNGKIEVIRSIDDALKALGLL